MKSFVHAWSGILAGAMVMTVISGEALAQVPGGGAPGLNSTLVKLFGRHTAFSARTDIRLLDRQELKESVNMTMDLAVLEGKVRADIDMTQVRSRNLNAGELARMQRLGMERFTTILRPDLQLTYYIYPALSAYVQIPTPKEPDPKIEDTKMDKEIVLGHRCVKQKLTVATSPSGSDKTEVLLWQASDLKDFPIRIQIYQPDAVVVMEFSNVQLSKPDPARFEAPTSYSKHVSVEQMVISRWTEK